MADKKYGKFGSSYGREINMQVSGKNLNDEQHEIVLNMCTEFKDKLMEALDDVVFDFPQKVEIDLKFESSRG